MKKSTIITIIVLVLSLNHLYSQNQPKDSTNTKTPERTAIQETERLIDKYGGKIIDTFNNVVEKSTPVAEQGFKIAVRLQLAEGIACVLPIIFMFIFGRTAFKEYNKLILDEKSPFNNEDEMTFTLVIKIVSTGLCALVALFSTYSGILHLIAPEWYAIKEIIDLIN